MLQSDIISIIRTRYPSFTKAEKKVADFILEEQSRVMYMSITELAQACSVGDTTVFRFCKDLDLQGYQGFKIALAQCINIEENETSMVTGDIVPEDALDDIAKKVLSSNIAALNETYSLCSLSNIATAVDWMTAARRVHFFGVGSSMLTALDAKNLLMRIMPNVSVTIDSHLQAMEAALLDPDDVAVVISYSGSTKDTNDIAAIVKESGARVIAITRFEKSPLSSNADLILLCGANEGPLQGGALSSKMAQLYVINMLYFELFRRNPKQSMYNKELTSTAVTKKMY